MITPLIKPKKTGRNEPCPCGSEKKYKKCCMKKVRRKLTELGFQQCMKKLVKDLGGTVDITYDDIQALPQDEALAISHNAEEDSFHFEVVKFKKSAIIQPDKRVIG